VHEGILTLSRSDVILIYRTRDIVVTKVVELDEDPGGVVRTRAVAAVVPADLRNVDA